MQVKAELCTPKGATLESFQEALQKSTCLRRAPVPVGAPEGHLWLSSSPNLIPSKCAVKACHRDRFLWDRLEIGPGGLPVTQLCFCFLEAEDPREGRQLLAQAARPGAQSSSPSYSIRASSTLWESRKS